MLIELKQGEHFDLRTPAGATINVECTIDTLQIVEGASVLYQETFDKDGWNETYPAHRQPVPLGTKIAPEVTGKEAYAICKHLGHRLGNFGFWLEHRGWTREYVEADGTRVYEKMLDDNTAAKVKLTVSPEGKRNLIIENI